MNRVPSIDCVRGLAMVLMALDHTRDYFAPASLGPEDLVLLTRLVTHFCAPTFVFLAGTSAYLSKSTPAKLVTRGLKLILLEFTLVFWAWHFNLDYGVIHLSVIWAIGCSMIALAPLACLPSWVTAVFGLVIVAGHNALDGLWPDLWFWQLLHVGGAQIGTNPTFSVVYPVLPWVGVMALGYSAGPIFKEEAGRQRKILLLTGAAATLLFFVLRTASVYGEPRPWSTALSFFDCTKYPPSLLFLLMTLGPMLLLLALLKPIPWLVTFGRVPLFYYLVHLYVIHAGACLLALVQTGDVGWMLHSFVALKRPAGYGLPLAGIYGIWLAVVTILYRISVTRLKSNSRGAALAAK